MEVNVKVTQPLDNSSSCTLILQTTNATEEIPLADNVNLQATFQNFSTEVTLWVERSNLTGKKNESTRKRPPSKEDQLQITEKVRIPLGEKDTQQCTIQFKKVPLSLNLIVSKRNLDEEEDGDISFDFVVKVLKGWICICGVTVIYAVIRKLFF